MLSPASRRAAHRRRGRRPLRLLIGTAIVVVLAWIGVGLGLRVAYSGEILPGTRVAGIDLGGSSTAAARRALASAFSPAQTVTLGHGDRRFVVGADEVGYRVDVGATAARAQRAGRSVSGFWSALPSLLTRRELTPVFRLDRSRLDAAIASIAREIERPAFPGGLSLEGSRPTVRAVAPRPGAAVDRRRAAAAVLAALHGRVRSVVPLPVRARPAVPQADVEAVVRRARVYLETPVRLTGRGEVLALSRRDLAPILAVEEVRGSAGPPVRLGVDRGRLERLIDELARDLHREPVGARIGAPARPFLVEAKGDLTWKPRRASVRVRSGRSGRMLDRPATAAALARAVRGGRHTVRLPLRRVVPPLSTTAARRVTSVLGTFTTRFACCQPRTANIALIAKAVDKTVVLPGERFSLNRVAGPRTRAAGYVPAPFIADGKVVPAVGGGVSQFSTTIYNAAYFAGLRIERHQPHSFYIDRYPAGREATLDYASIDLVWVNDTGAPVFVRATADATSVTVTLYGKSRVGRVEARTGPRLARSGGGFAITVTRTVIFRGGRSRRDSYTTSYERPPVE